MITFLLPLGPGSPRQRRQRGPSAAHTAIGGAFRSCGPVSSTRPLAQDWPIRSMKRRRRFSLCLGRVKHPAPLIAPSPTVDYQASRKFNDQLARVEMETIRQPVKGPDLSWNTRELSLWAQAWWPPLPTRILS